MEDSSESYDPSKESCRRSARNRRYREKLKVRAAAAALRGTDPSSECVSR